MSLDALTERPGLFRNRCMNLYSVLEMLRKSDIKYQTSNSKVVKLLRVVGICLI